jgi:hypothetical protein
MRYLGHNSPLMDPFPSQINPIHIFTSYFFKIQAFRLNFVYMSHFYKCFLLPLQLNLPDFITFIIFVKGSNYEASHDAIFSFFLIHPLSLTKSKYSPQHNVLEHIFLGVRDKTTGKITLVYINIYSFR